VSLFTPEVLDRINRIVVEHGQQVIGKKKDEGPGIPAQYTTKHLHAIYGNKM
jgi:hypothetical protein